MDANRKARAVAFSQYKKVERYVDEDGLVSYMGLDIEDPDDNQPNLSVEKVILLPEGSEDEVEVGEGWEVSVEVEHEYGHGEDGTGTLG